MMVTCRDLYPEFDWRETTGPYWMDKLTGTDRARLRSTPVRRRRDRRGWKRDLAGFRRLRSRHLLYPGGRS